MDPAWQCHNQVSEYLPPRRKGRKGRRNGRELFVSLFIFLLNFAPLRLGGNISDSEFLQIVNFMRPLWLILLSMSFFIPSEKTF